MPFQLTISRQDLPAAQALRRKSVMAFGDDLPVRIGGPQSECPLDGCDDDVATIRWTGRAYRLMVLKEDALLNRQAAPSSTQLHSGDMLTVSGWNLQFHRQLAKAKLSWRSTILARLSQLTIALILVVLVLTMFWLPEILRQSSRWDRSANAIRLSMNLESTRERVQKLGEAKELATLPQLLLENIEIELGNETRYLRNFDGVLTHQQLDQQLATLERLNAVLDSLENGISYPPLPQPALDDAVKSILQKTPQLPTDHD